MPDVAALVESVRKGDVDGVAAAIQANPELTRAHADNGVSVICLSVYMGQRKIAEQLAEKRNDLDVFEASVLGRTARVSSLIRHDELLINACSPDGFHPLGYACFFGHRELFDCLIDAGADVNASARNGMKVRPLHSAAASLDPNLALYMAQVLINEGADVNAQQQGGFTPLQEAAHRGHMELIDALLAAGADKAHRNEEGNDAVGLACKAGHHHLAAKLDPASA